MSSEVGEQFFIIDSSIVLLNSIRLNLYIVHNSESNGLSGFWSKIKNKYIPTNNSEIEVVGSQKCRK